ncbi:superfamily II DNA or RNA helicase [Tumebacillus sp. BK434]|uniref:DUF3427 domain-containing protein n=1 Tax=Tumebacillus sp. BK434 TaxID=2512169 RepID=UPI001044737F|nr:DUF3427 domain-containing protein [Tumebacillus sp. BK434]TCP54630.1 superfamily II DNA or RNA helicase [Tumebacillus sp. BK434]
MTVYDNSGLFEELKQKGKSYPENNKSNPLHPKAYADALIQQISTEIGQRLYKLAEDSNYDQMFQLVTTLKQQLNESVTEYDLPLQSIHYSNEDRFIPDYSDMFLTTSQLITNYGVGKRNLYKTIKFELQSTDRADLMVSFIRWKGLQLLLRPFDQLLANKKPIRVLTSTYLNYTEPKALERLLELENVEVKIFDSGHKSFHTKAYLFSRNSDLSTGIIGSSNISRAAFVDGYEWNVKLPDLPHIPIYSKASKVFEEMWNDPRAIPVTPSLLESYKIQYEAGKIASSRREKFKPFETPLVAEPSAQYGEQLHRKIEPNLMQQKALAALQNTRKDGNDKGVVIAATGTGKTYLSAFDVHQFQAKRMLFLAHRDELLMNAQETFAEVYGSYDLFGKLTGTEKNLQKPFLFSTVQTMHRAETLAQFPHDHFDYIIVDEFHHAQAETYRKVLDHFQPMFLLGLTATPERMDGRDVLALCDFNVVYEIRLHQALENELLAPFHYFGLNDPTIDYNEIEQQNGFFEEASLVHALKTNERVEYIKDMIEKFGYDGDRLVALGFCANVDHAKFMTDEFNKIGYHAACLTGNDDPKARQKIIARLEDDHDPLQIIFTVDIFNEGIDIPKLNVLLFLRPTESATIFIQQLGRGLRKIDGKEYVTVLDFIGNYKKSFVVPLALSGQTNHRAFDRESLRKAVENEFSELPEGCYVDLEEISRQQILEKLDQVRMNNIQLLTDLYFQFRKELGRSPELVDFLYNEQAPSLFYFVRRFGSWVETKKRMKDLNEFDSALLEDHLALQIIQRLERMFPLKWPYEFIILELAFQHEEVQVPQVLTELQRRFRVPVTAEQHKPYVVRAMERLSEEQSKFKWSFGRVLNDTFSLEEPIKHAMDSERNGKYIRERFNFGLTEFRRTHRPELTLSNQNGIMLHQNYTRSDLMFLFQVTVTKSSWREGVRQVGNNYLLFVTLIKDEGTADHLNYEDYFIDQQNFHWQSQPKTTHKSKVGQNYIHNKERGIHIHLFVRKFAKMHGMTLPFMYLGEMDYVSSHGDKPMNIKWRLQSQVPDEIFNDLIR